MIKEQQKEPENVYALTREGAEIFIGDVVRGRKGYFCLSCKKEMQAVKSEIQGRKQFFRHDPKAYLPGERKCTYSDETYRHKLAKTILQDIKKIKVPALYKYPPLGVKGPILFLSEAKFIEGKSVKLELPFFEDENGHVRWGKENVNQRNLLIKPDVTFFNNKGIPILLIEIVATHKITEEKYVKIKRLGFDTVCVSIPKDSPENIKKALLTSQYTQWVYNYEQESATYVSIAETNGDGISSAKQNQSGVFNETISCREFQVSELIRRIRLCLEASEYRNTIEYVRSKISRAENLTEHLEEQRRKLQARIRAEVEEKYRTRREAIDREKKQFEREQEEFERDLQTRITKEVGISESDLQQKIEDLESEESDADKRFLQNKDAFVNQIGNFRLQIATIDGEQNTIGGKIKSAERYIYSLQSSVERVRRDILSLPNDEENCRGAIAKNSKIITEIGINLAAEEERTGELRKEIDDRIRGIRKEIEETIGNEERAIVNTVETRDFSGDSYFAKICKRTSDDLRLYKDWSSLEEKRIRFSRGDVHISFEDYKNWHD